jgi:uncharacterized membrane-anchored protein
MSFHSATIERLSCTTLLLVTLIASGFAEEGAPAPAARREFKPQTGTIIVGDKLATLKLPEGMIYFAQDDARYVLEQEWHNPPDTSVLGLVIKPGATEQDDDSVVVVSYSNDGHVDDADARSIDYDDLLKQMQEGADERNDELKKQGYRTERLLGWAESPHYDSDSKKVYWAKSLQFGEDTDPKLNYCIRILGRTGVLELNALGRTADLAVIAPVAKQVMGATEFNEGNRYEDFKEGTDLKQAGGIAALIVGGVVAKKLGLLALIGVGLLKFGKILIIPLLFGGGWIASWFKRRKKKEDSGRDEIRRVDDEVKRVDDDIRKPDQQ